jgi:N-acetylglucosamine-6-phosphate deacetylase
MTTRRAPSRKTPPKTRATPGFFDLQVNGFAGVDFQQPDLTARQLAQAVTALHAHGTDRILLTLITDRVDRLCAKLARIEGILRRHPALARTIVGYHLEGPYLLPERGYCGAHEPQWMHAPSIAEFEQLWTAARGRIRLMTLAPEWPGSPAFIRHLVAKGVRVAIGHSNANANQIDAAIEAGLSLCTHLGNGVPLQLDRHDNIVQRLLARDELHAAFIPDGIHLPPNVLKNFVRAKPRNNVLFTTDAMAAAGAGPGRYRIAHLMTEVGTDGIVRQPGETHYFAGSSLTMDVAVVNVTAMTGWTAAEARVACSTRVADYLGY